jgi:hypothetical protein
VGGVRNHNQIIKKLQAQKKVNPEIMVISISIFDWIFKYSEINPTLKPTSKEIIATLKMIPLFEEIHSLFLYQNSGVMIYSANASHKQRSKLDAFLRRVFCEKPACLRSQV